MKTRFPSLSVDDVDVGTDSPDDGFIDPYLALMGIRKKAIGLGAVYLKDRVVDFQRSDNRVQALMLESGETLKADIVVNAANCWGVEFCEKLGMKVPVHPMRRLTFYFEINPVLGLHALDPAHRQQRDLPARRQGLHRRPHEIRRGFRLQLGCRSRLVHGRHLARPRGAREGLRGSLKVQSSWSGHYDQNTFDNNAIIGPWIGGCENFYVVLGYSGHGLQHGPATGRAIKELLIDGGYQTLDLSRLSYQRIIDEKPLHDLRPFA